MPLSRDALRASVGSALLEDAPAGDLTSWLLVPDELKCRAELTAKSSGVLAGTRAAAEVFGVAAEQDGLGTVDLEWRVEDGEHVAPSDVVAVVTGPARTILRAERVAINFLAHLSGVATTTRAFVEAARPAVVLCTRKTTPGLRELEREAVVAGGGYLHRASLSEAVLIKDNHLRLAGGGVAAIQAARAAGLPVEIEVETLDEAREAFAAGADRILVDNAGSDLVRAILALAGDPERVEVSGGVTLESVGALVQAGARVISVGRITHSAPALDLSLEVR